MPTKKALERAQEDKRGGKSASTQAGEFVRDEIEKKAYRRPAARALILSLQKKASFPKNPEKVPKALIKKVSVINLFHLHVQKPGKKH